MDQKQQLESHYIYYKVELSAIHSTQIRPFVPSGRSTKGKVAEVGIIDVLALGRHPH